MATLRVLLLASALALAGLAFGVPPAAAIDPGCGGNTIEVCIPVCITEPCPAYVCIHVPLPDAVCTDLPP